ncbi:hypothetical protein BST27_25640 [Mycobacterium intermedium]|uniref:Uncharacterized protein n=1 Tax=Mycobacterium intermedium TaxID=28445 RepID=A0A1E3S573_MYCIE|nr:hypothetical protein [Mycobacterium intermedium]MCV6966044.1 hypothetical protein [Mycobacterium intermedium]ODQ97306.1 hypothetical protein BHQ20_27085 [Mycobacterium intermedium]OPE47042.1 hypothetical protein BV508_23680 [Mycobacterium intermedium]ORA96410.1 hypothetical protein BST27_25640 [Mycobacterium intermedium]
MAEFRVIDPRGEVVATKEIESAEDAHAWFVDAVADKELGWRLEVNDDGEWAFFENSDSAPS